MTRGEAGELPHPHRLPAAPLQEQHHPEGARGGERVDEQVEEHGAVAERAARHHADQHVPDVGDRRVREHPLEVAAGRSPTRLPMVMLSAASTHTSGAQSTGPRAARRGARARARRRPRPWTRWRSSTVTEVGAPWYTSAAHMWNGTEEILNPKPTSRRPKPITRSGSRAAPARHRGGDPVEVGGAGGAVHEGDPVQEEPGGEGPEQEVLERRLARLEAVAEEPGEHVQRDRHDLQPEEDHDQVAGGGHQHHARPRRRARGCRTRPTPSPAAARSPARAAGPARPPRRSPG